MVFLGRPIVSILIVSGLVISAACSRVSVDEHLRRGDDHFKAARFPEAVLEYRAALQTEPNRADVRLRLADAHGRVGNLRGALDESVRAADLLPQDPAVQIRAGHMLLIAKSWDDAKARADRALNVDAKNVDALVLRGHALAAMTDLEGALAEFHEAAAIAPDEASLYETSGAILAFQGKHTEAEASFRKAIEVAPTSLNARLGLANLLWGTRRSKEAEETLKAAVALDPASVPANRALATFYLAARRIAEAEPYVEALAKAANTDRAMLSLADYFALSRRDERAAQLLEGLATKPDTAAGAFARLAAIDERHGRRSDALRRLHDGLAKYPKELPARLLLSRVLLAGGQRDEALELAASIVRDDPSSSVAGPAFVIIGGIQTDADRREAAREAYNEALKRLPRSSTASLALAMLDLSDGDVDQAAAHVKNALAAQPDSPVARSIEVRVLLARGDKAKSGAALAQLRKQFADSPTVLKLTGELQMADGALADARTSYASALARSPHDLEALTALVRIDLATNRRNDALKRIDAGLSAQSPTADLLVLAARTYGAAGQTDRAEALLKQAIDKAPARLEAYELLGRFYAGTGRLDEATRQFQQLVEQNPKSVPGHTMLGMLSETTGHRADAEQYYRRALSINARAPVAANNLAWMIATARGNLEESLALAKAAQEQMPAEPHFNDTLGWIYYVRDSLPLAIRHLEISVKANPTNAGGHFRLGMAYYKNSDWPHAKTSLTRALALQPSLDGADEARKALAIIG